MALSCSVPLASLAETGRDLFGSTATLSRPPMRDSAKLVCKLRLESQMSNGYQKRVFLLHQTPVRKTFAAVTNQAIVFTCLTRVYWIGSFSGALELWELAEDERLLVNRFTKHEHDHIVTTVSPISGGSGAVTGSMDCRWDIIFSKYTHTSRTETCCKTSALGLFSLFFSHLSHHNKVCL